MATAWRQIWVVYGVGVLAAAQLGLVPPLLPALRADLGISLTMAATAISIVAMVGAAFGVLAGGWSARLGHGRSLGLGIVVMAGAAALCAIANDAVALLAARALAGVGYLIVVVAGPSLMAGLAAERHHSFTLSLWGTFVPVGIALSAMAAATLLEHASWRVAFAADAALLLAAWAAALATLRRSPVATPGAHGRSIGVLRSALPLSVAFFCFALLFLALVGLLPAYLVGSRGLAEATAGRVVGIATVFGIAGSLLAGPLMRRGVPPGWLIVTGLVASTLVAVIFLQAAAPAFVAAAGFALSFALGGLVPAATFASAPRIARDAHAIGLINGLIAQAGSVGSLAGPPLLAACIDMAGWNAVPSLLLAIAALGSGCALNSRGSRLPASRDGRSC